MVLVKNDKVLSIIDNKILFDAKYKQSLEKMINLLRQNTSPIMKFWNSQKDTVTIIPNKISSAIINQSGTRNLIDRNHTWEPFNNTTVFLKNNILRILANNNNTANIYSGASLKTKLDLKNALLLLEYTSKSSTVKVHFMQKLTCTIKMQSQA